MPPRKRANLVHEVPDPRGPVERAVALQLTTLEFAADRPGLAASALVLAAKLDTDAGLATAAVARELRATLAALARADDGDTGVEVADLISRLSS